MMKVREGGGDTHPERMWDLQKDTSDGTAPVRSCA